MKHRLRHPIQSVREPFGKAGLIVACLALVFAMVGGAYAAGKLTGKQKKEVEKIAKKFAGKPGANGTNGTNGSAGAKGDTGGLGTPGTSATTSSFTGAKAPCTEGGVEVKSASPTVLLCNGKKGDAGPPGPLSETLPAGKSSTGLFAVSDGTTEVTAESAAAGFPFRVESATGEPPTAQFIPEGGTPQAGCSGTASEPVAEPGNLCVFAQEELNVFQGPGFAPHVNAKTSGFFLSAFAKEAGTFVLKGSWAVTAEE